MAHTPNPRCRVGDVRVPAGPATLHGRLTRPLDPVAVVVLADAGGGGAAGPVLHLLHRAGLATLLVDLLTCPEAADPPSAPDVELLAGRLGDATAWVRGLPDLAGLPVGWLGAGPAATAAGWAAADPGTPVAAVVVEGGRPDLTGPRLGRIRAPTLLVVGSFDPVAADRHQAALGRLRCPGRLTVVSDDAVTAVDEAADAAFGWFLQHLVKPDDAGADEVSRPGAVPAER